MLTQIKFYRFGALLGCLQVEKKIKIIVRLKQPRSSKGSKTGEGLVGSKVRFFALIFGSIVSLVSVFQVLFNVSVR